MRLNRRQTLTGISALSLAQLTGCQSNDAPSGKADLTRLDAIDQAKLIKSGHISAAELMEATLNRVAKIDPKINAFTDINGEMALERAASKLPDTPLAGVPYALKDLNEYPGLKYERGTAMFKDVMGQNKTPYTKKIDDSGVIVFGKTATPEFGLLGTTEPLAYKACRNPWKLDHSAGGSSGGAAAAVAARIIPMAQASDGGGSIRNPASQCGVLGLKPSRGRFPAQANARRDIEISIKHAVSLSVRDTAAMLALTEHQNGPLTPVGFVLPGPSSPLTIAVTINDITGLAPHDDVKAAVLDCASRLEELGHNIQFVDKGPELHPDLFNDFVVLWGQSVVPITQAAEQISGKSARESGLLENWTLELSERFLALDDATVAGAISRLKSGGSLLRNWLTSFDAWLTPAAAMPAPLLGWTSGNMSFETNLERSSKLVGHFAIHNVAGTPGISIPWGFSDGLPLGIQLSARMGGEATLLKLAYQLEEANPWMDIHPVLL